MPEQISIGSPPTVFHITHHKAGSQWVAEVLKYCAPERVVCPKPRAAHFYEQPLIAGGLYLSVYVPSPDFTTITAAFTASCRNFVVMRDLRDTLVSWYFSLRYSHPVMSAFIAKAREILGQLDEEEGLLALLTPSPALKTESFAFFLPTLADAFVENLNRADFLAYLARFTEYIAHVQTSWMDDHDTLRIRYEDLVADEYAAFERIVDYCQINVTRQRLHEIVRSNTFEMVTGRQPGQEENTCHQRKGIVGDWRNYFSARVKDEFKQRFGSVLIRTGYESHLNW